MATPWQVIPKDPSTVNSGNKYEIGFNNSVDMVNIANENSFFAVQRSEEAYARVSEADAKSNKAFALTQTPDSSNIAYTGVPGSVTILPDGRLRFNNIVGQPGEPGIQGLPGNTGAKGESGILVGTPGIFRLEIRGDDLWVITTDNQNPFRIENGNLIVTL